MIDTKGTEFVGFPIGKMIFLALTADGWRPQAAVQRN
jgi:hypothetical protein